jgi:cation:H+ antiporter
LKEERFTKVYDHTKDTEKESPKGFKTIFKETAILLGGLALLLISSEAIVRFSSFFAANLGVSVAFIGFLIVGSGNAFPELFFSIASARAGQTWMILGNLMGSVVITSTLVLGIVALIEPIQISDFSPFAVARFFLLISSLFFLLFIRTDRKITKKEGLFLLAVYIAFVIAEILIR